MCIHIEFGYLVVIVGMLLHVENKFYIVLMCILNMAVSFVHTISGKLNVVSYIF